MSAGLITSLIIVYADRDVRSYNYYYSKTFHSGLVNRVDKTFF